METADIDRALDMRFVLTYVGTLPISEFSRSKGISFQSGLMFGSSQMEISCFIPDNLEANREVSIFLAQNKVQKHNKISTLSFSFENRDINGALEFAINGMRSAVLDNMTIVNGVYNLSFRFSSRDLPVLSDTLLRYTAILNDVGINYLGPNPGIDSIAREMTTYIPLINFEFSLDIPEGQRVSPKIDALGKEWVSEARFMSSASRFNQIVMTSEKINEPEKYGIVPIDEEKHLYELDLESDLLAFYFQKNYDYRILRVRRTIHYLDGKLLIGVTIPEVISENFLKILSETAEKFPQWHLMLRKVSRVY